MKSGDLDIIPSPKMSSLPATAQRRLIDNGLVHYEASIAGLSERYGRGETSHTIHVWWARRPHSAMRVLVFASLCRESKQDSYRLLTEIGANPIPDEEKMQRARKLLRAQYKRPPIVLDMFGGAGTIAYETLNVGAEAYSIDANELAVFIQHCNLIYSQCRKQMSLSQIVEKSGIRVIERLAIDSMPLFPLRKKDILGYSNESPICYLWTYSTLCRHCGYKYYLSKRPWLSKQNNKNFGFYMRNEKKSQVVCINTLPKDYKHPSVWIGRNGRVQCPNCGAVNNGINVLSCNEEIVSMVRLKNGRGKDFSPGTNAALPPLDLLQKTEKYILKELDAGLPDSMLPEWSGIVNPSLYGIRTHADFLNLRQRIVLLLLIRSLQKEYKVLIKEHRTDVAKCIVAILSSLMDQLIDWNCRLSMWISQNEQVGRAFCGPGVAMLWDYVEIDPVLYGPANLWDKLKRIVKAVNSIPTFAAKAKVLHASADSLPFDSDFFDAVVTDPPYYDNLYYSALADFFYSWKRILLKQINPCLFQPKITNSTKELVASSFRNGNPLQAHEKYCKQLTHAVKEGARVLKPEGVMSFIFSHSSLVGWEAFLRAFRNSNLIITSVQPLSIERRQRPRAMTSEAVNTCIAFIAHKRMHTGKHPTKRESILRKFSSICTGAFPTALEASGWHKNDISIALYSQGVAMLSNVSRVIDCTNDKEMLIALEDVLKQTFPEFKVQKRVSL